MARLLQWLDRSQLVKAQDEEIEELRREIERLRSQNERIRGSMRRCITCDYRAEVNAAR
ncbi:MAG: hypothetical protein QF570_05595 [Myxococcota bacterium]|nr:hypothetical protein [Myxococcota bacterium]